MVRKDIAAIKVAMPKVYHDIATTAPHMHGALGVSNEMPFMGMCPMLRWSWASPTGRPRSTRSRSPARSSSATSPTRASGRPSTSPNAAPRPARSSPISSSTRPPSCDGHVPDLGDRRRRGAHRGPRRHRRPHRLDGRRDLPGSGEPMEVTFISGGSSNEIFEIRRGEHRVALRRPPRIVPEGRNTTMLREYRVLEALNGTDVPHPEAVAVCDDPSVIGACFYLMGHVDGWSPDELREGVARTVRHRPRRPRRARDPARRRDRPPLPGRLAGPGPRRAREARRVPRAPGRPVARASRQARLPRAARHRRRRRLAPRPHARHLRARHHPRRLPVRQRHVRPRRTGRASPRSSTGR